jgi:hypothetical protein
LSPQCGRRFIKFASANRNRSTYVVTEIARTQLESSLTAAIRVYLMSYFRAEAMLAAHARLVRAG